MWGAILSTGLQVGGSLLGGLFGRSSEKRARRDAIAQRNWAAEREDTQIQRMADDARAAGINPLTALRGGGSAGYAQTHMPVLSGSAVATAAHGAAAGLAAGVQAAFDYNPLDEQRSMIENELMQAQIARINQDMALDTRIGQAPTATASRYETGAGAMSQTHGRHVSNPFAVDSGIQVDPNMPDAELAEARYGDMAQELFGFRNAIADYSYNNSRTGDISTRPVRRSRGHVPSVTFGDEIISGASWVVNQLRRANQRARFNNRFNTAYGW